MVVRGILMSTITTSGLCACAPCAAVRRDRRSMPTPEVGDPARSRSESSPRTTMELCRLPVRNSTANRTLRVSNSERRDAQCPVIQHMAGWDRSCRVAPTQMEEMQCNDPLVTWRAGWVVGARAIARPPSSAGLRDRVDRDRHGGRRQDDRTEQQQLVRTVPAGGPYSSRVGSSRQAGRDRRRAEPTLHGRFSLPGAIADVARTVAPMANVHNLRYPTGQDSADQVSRGTALRRVGHERQAERRREADRSATHAVAGVAARHRSFYIDESGASVVLATAGAAGPSP